MTLHSNFDYLLIESTGISEPLPVAETFTFEDENGQSLSQLAELDTMVTVVDAGNFLKDFGSWDDLTDRRIGLNYRKYWGPVFIHYLKRQRIRLG